MAKKKRTVPTREQVLKAAESCPEAATALRTLFPEDFVVQEQKLNWLDVRFCPLKYVQFPAQYDTDVIVVRQDLAKAIGFTGWPTDGRPGCPGPGWVGWHTSLDQMIEVLTKIQTVYEEKLDE